MKKLLSAVISAAMIFGCTGLYSAGEDISAVSEYDKVIALTFDDGPNTTTTNEILDVLEEYDARATFFLIGNNINDESAVSVKRAYDMGCEIGNHSKSHSNMPDLTAEEISAEIDYVEDYVFEITGEYTSFSDRPLLRQIRRCMIQSTRRLYAVSIQRTIWTMLRQSSVRKRYSLPQGTGLLYLCMTPQETTRPLRL